MLKQVQHDVLDFQKLIKAKNQNIHIQRLINQTFDADPPRRTAGRLWLIMANHLHPIQH